MGNPLTTISKPQRPLFPPHSPPVPILLSIISSLAEANWWVPGNEKRTSAELRRALLLARWAWHKSGLRLLVSDSSPPKWRYANAIFNPQLPSRDSAISIPSVASGIHATCAV